MSLNISTSADFEVEWSRAASRVDSFISESLGTVTEAREPGLKKLAESMKYSAIDGGKRFRPVLCLFAAEALGINPQKVIAFASAIELVHCYSLIHDDLPAMDNDLMRRGKPTNHRVYGEAMALLAGNALYTEAISLILREYKTEPGLATELIKSLTDASGFSGMIGGQAIDIFRGETSLTEADIQKLHALKTGAMIRVAVEGAAIVADVDSALKAKLVRYGEIIGHAFQVADDILDFNPEKPEPISYTTIIGFENTQKLLTKLTEEALAIADALGAKAIRLSDVAKYNFNRKK